MQGGLCPPPPPRPPRQHALRLFRRDGRHFVIAVFLWNYFLSDIFVVNQRVAIPNFVGSNYETIINSKEFKGKYNFDLIYEIDPNVERGIIIGQSPDAGKSYMLTSDGIHVTLTVSTGVMLTEIPNLLNYDYREATSELEKLGFVCGQNVCRFRRCRGGTA